VRQIDDHVLDRLPEARRPTRWGAFVEAARSQPEPWFSVTWEDPAALFHLPLAADVAAALVPFLALGDGGLLAWWMRGDETWVVHLGSYGERTVIARDFDTFLGRLCGRTTGLPHLDELPPPEEVPVPPPAFQVAGVSPLPAEAPEEQGRLDQAFAAWVEPS
jgi:hypothetical protein